MFTLPKVIKGKNIEFEFFPTKMQALIFRSWEMVPAEKLAKLLKTSSENVKKLAFEMGLKEQKYTDEWLLKGYITIIKAVWHLLPYSQILELLDWTEERLAYVLKEDDFLDIKLGEFKPDCEELFYRELTPEEKLKTQKIKASIEKSGIDFNSDEAVPFNFFEYKNNDIKQSEILDIEITDEWSIKDFTKNTDVKAFTEDFKNELNVNFGITLCEKSDKSFNLSLDESLSDNEEYHEIYINKNSVEIKATTPVGIMRGFYYLTELTKTYKKCTFKIKTYKRNPVFKTRYIYSFCGLYSDVLDQDGEISFPEKLLKEYARREINGVWIQAILYKLTEFPFDKQLSEGWQKRMENLKKLSLRAAKYGIKIYLYINEPRSMPLALFEKHPEIKGHQYPDGNTCMCTLTEKVQLYLKEALQTIVKNVPLLGGFFAITASENHTNCCSHFGRIDAVNCPNCSKEKPASIIAKTIGIMADAVFEVNPDIRFFAWDWSWDEFLSEDEITEIIKYIPKKVILQSVSEHKLEYEFGGIKGTIDDYSLSMAGPSEWTKKIWKIAKKFGHECSAKVQINNSWECSTAPFLPVYDTILKHMKNLRREKVEHIMLSWTLGGYPSDNIKIASGFFFENEDMSSEDSYNQMLKITYGENSDIIKKASTHFSKAFSHYPFDLDSLYMGTQNLGVANLLFTKPTGFEPTMTCYPYDGFNIWRSVYPENVFLSQLEKLCNEWEKGLKLIKNMPENEFYDMAVYGYSLFKSSYNQALFYSARNKGEIIPVKLIENEKELAVQNYKIMQRNYAIGYEAANHYYVTKTMLLEKIIQCDYIRSENSI